MFTKLYITSIYSSTCIIIIIRLYNFITRFDGRVGTRHYRLFDVQWICIDKSSKQCSRIQVKTFNSPEKFVCINLFFFIDFVSSPYYGRSVLAYPKNGMGVKYSSETLNDKYKNLRESLPAVPFSVYFFSFWPLMFLRENIRKGFNHNDHNGGGGVRRKITLYLILLFFVTLVIHIFKCIYIFFFFVYIVINWFCTMDAFRWILATVFFHILKSPQKIYIYIYTKMWYRLLIVFNSFFIEIWLYTRVWYYNLYVWFINVLLVTICFTLAVSR